MRVPAEVVGHTLKQSRGFQVVVYLQIRWLHAALDNVDSVLGKIDESALITCRMTDWKVKLHTLGKLGKQPQMVRDLQVKI